MHDLDDEAVPNPRHSMDPLVSVMQLAETAPGSRTSQPASAPIKGSTHRPDFRTIAPLRSIIPENAAPLDTYERLAADQRRRESAQEADRERIAALPNKEELQARRMAALEADVADLRVRIARLEGPHRHRGRSTRPSDDFPPAAA